MIKVKHLVIKPTTNRHREAAKRPWRSIFFKWKVSMDCHGSAAQTLAMTARRLVVFMVIHHATKLAPQKMKTPIVTPAKAGVQTSVRQSWIPAFAGMTSSLEAILRRIFTVITAVVLISLMFAIKANADNLDRPHRAYTNSLKQDKVQRVQPLPSKLKIRDVELIVEDKTDMQIANNVMLRSYIKALLESGTNQELVERYIMLINKIPGYEAQYTLRKERQESRDIKSAEIVIAVKRTKMKFKLDANNYGNADIGKYQFSAFGQLTNIFNANESIIVAGAISNKPNALSVITAGVLKRLNTDGTSVNLLFSYLKDNPFISFANSGSDKSFTYKGELEHYFVLNNTNTFKVELPLELRTAREDLPFNDGVLNDYRYFLFSPTIKARHLDQLEADNAISCSFKQAFGTKIKQIGSNRKFDKAFNYLVLDFTRNQPLPLSLSAFMSVAFYYAPGTLPIEQQFSVGSSTVGRGYQTGLISSNQGVNIQLEARYTHEIKNNKVLEELQPYLFFEYAKIYKPVQQINKTTLNSFGCGVRFSTPWQCQANFEAAVPVSKTIVLNNVNTITNDIKLSFSVSKELRF